ncbi:PAS domain S-box protein [Azospirillum sp. RWY-5-1]|uniref:histidine kinase n=1 Tax=Azospirillum oleiclasticum TaxID=2735135 RepID=A0ABX2T1T6_9PROT|nr:PAS domain S-box protein [Azospirillum oleiclasticum]NYZ11110.1 PAS domain S-box protein [Azospirillum oleiclasticum]NYZ18272.1 PAS domain S-box protein [Azospirillum oleiclasticum]
MTATGLRAPSDAASPTLLRGVSALAVAALAAVILLLGSEIWRERNDRLENLRSQAERRAILMAQHADSVIGQADVALVTYAFLIESFDERAADDGLQRVMTRQLPPGGCITTVDARNETVGSTCLRPRQRTIPPEEFSAHATGRATLTLGHDPELATVALRRSVVRPDGRFAGAIQAIFDASVLLGYERSLGGRDVDALATRSGEIVAGPGMLYAGHAAGIARQAVALAAARTGGPAGAGVVDGPTMVVATSQLRTLPLQAVAASPKGELLAEWTTIAVSAGLIALIIGGGGALLVAAMVRTERARAATLTELRLRNQALDQATNGVILCRAGGGNPIVYVNAAFERTTGYAAHEVIGRNPRFLQGDESRQPELFTIRNALKEGLPVQVTVRNYRKSGAFYYNDVSIAPVHDPDGRITHFIGIQQDVTARVLAEQAMEDRLRFEHTLLDTIPLPVFSVDLDGVFIAANRAFEEVLGQPRGSLQGRRVRDVIPDDPDGLHADADRRLIERGGSITYETRIQLADGTLHDIIVKKAAFLNASSRTAGLVGVFSDITDMKRRETELARLVEQRDHERIRAEEASRAKSNFLACMSHELRTPLNAILGFSEIIRERVFGDDWTRYAEYAGDIHDSGSHLLALINDILDLSKIEAGKLDLAPVPLGVEPVVESVVRLVRQRAADHGHTMSVDYGDTAGLMLFADDRAVRQILFNLLSNAIKFTPDKGHIAVICCSAGPDAVALAVSDNGIGIPADRIQMVLKPFERIGDAYTRKQEGTGLGLSLVDSLVSALHGSLHIDSTLGAGTTVTVTLPSVRKAGVKAA